MPISVITNFDVNTQAPIDSRMVVSNPTDRNSIVYKYHGLKIFQTNDNSTWVWTGSTWSRELNGIYGGSGSLIGNTDVDLGSFESGTTNKLSFASSVSKAQHYISWNGSVQNFNNTIYSIEYNGNNSLGPYLRLNGSGGIGLGVGLGDSVTESITLLNDGRVGINSTPVTNFQIGSQSHAPITINTGSTFSSIGFNWFDYLSTRQKMNNSREAAQIHLSNNNTLSIRTSAQGSSTINDRIVISNNLVNIPGFFGASAVSIGSIGNNTQLLLATASISPLTGLLNNGGEIRYQNLNFNRFGQFVFNSGWDNLDPTTNTKDPLTGLLTGNRPIASFIGGHCAKGSFDANNASINRMTINVGKNGFAGGRPSMSLDFDEITGRSNTIPLNGNDWFGVQRTLGVSTIFSVSDSQNSSFIFRGGSYNTTSPSVSYPRNILTLLTNAVRIEQGRALSFNTNGVDAFESAVGSITLINGSNTIIGHPLLGSLSNSSLAYGGITPKVLLSAESNGNPSSWGALSYSMPQPNVITIQSSNANDNRRVNFFIYYEDNSGRS